MRAISVRQPWAWAIVHGGKDVENRGRPDPWRSAVGERVFIHAAKTFEWADEVMAAALAGFPPCVEGEQLPPDAYTLGALVGAATIRDVHHAGRCFDVGATFCSPWAQPQSWHLVLADVEPLPEPVPYRGALGLFEVTVDLT